MSKLNWWMWGSIAFLAMILAVVTWVAWPPPEAPRARVFRDFDVCLLTGQQGISAGPAAAAWEGLQEVSRQTDVKVSYLAVTGDQTEARARLFVASQIQQRCGIIVSVGTPQTAAAKAMSDTYPQVKFVALTEEVKASDVTARVRPLIP